MNLLLFLFIAVLGLCAYFWKRHKLSEEEKELIKEFSWLLQASIQDLPGMLRMIAEEIRERLGFKTVMIGLLDEKKRWLERIEAVGITGTSFEDLKRYRIPIQELEERMKEADKIGNVFMPDDDTIIVPIAGKEEILGVLEGTSPDGKVMSMGKRIRLLNLLLPLIAKAIENAKMVEEEKHTLEKVGVVYEVASMIGRIMRTDILLPQVVEAIRSRLNYLNVAILLPERGRLRIKVHAGYPDIDMKKAEKEIGPERGVTYMVYKTGEPMLVPDVRKEPLYVGNRSIGKSEIAVPIKSKGKVIGVLDVEKFGANSLDESDLEVLKILASFISVALENASLYEKVEKMAITDPLTGAYNHRVLQDEIKHLLKEKRRFSILFIDLDNFKAFNDSLGHITGDKILKEVVRIVGKEIKKRDTLIRYGGDEFVVVMPEVSKEEAKKVGEKIKEGIKKARKIKSYAKKVGIPLTASMGVVSHPDDGKELKTLMRKVDDALYRAKKLGKDKVVT